MRFKYQHSLFIFLTELGTSSLGKNYLLLKKYMYCSLDCAVYSQNPVEIHMTDS